MTAPSAATSAAARSNGGRWWMRRRLPATATRWSCASGRSDRISASAAAAQACAAVTVVSASGSVPREAGARMVVRDDGAFRGTIGGGALEWRAIADAQALAVHGDQVVMRERALGAELGPCCGGRVRIA